MLIAMADAQKLAKSFVFQQFLFVENEESGEFTCFLETCPVIPILDNNGNIVLRGSHNHSQYEALDLDVEQNFDGLRLEMIRL